MRIKWYTPEEKMPPIGKPVMVNIVFPCCGEMHTMGWFKEKGWEVLATETKYTVSKWAYFPEGETV